MPIRYVPYTPNPVEGQAVLSSIARPVRVLSYRENSEVFTRIARGMPLYELEEQETVGEASDNLLVRGECVSACAYLKEKNVKLDLVYIDPPFASGADYAKTIYLRRNPHKAAELATAEQELGNDELRAFEETMYGDIWKKEDYLNWMYENLTAIKSVMSETGSIYVHLDWHIGHYVKILMDEIFGEDNFRNEIVWRRSDAHNDKTLTNYGNIHDVIFFYVKDYEQYVWNRVSLDIEENVVERDYRKEKDTGRLYRLGDLAGPGGRGVTYAINGITMAWKWSKEKFRRAELEGRIYYTNTGRPFYKIYLEEHSGVPLQSLWTDCPQIKGGTENVNYATQKPEKLLDRIIRNSSNDGMVVADFFGGSGVTAKVANDLGRRFVHVDVGINSVQTARDRLKQAGASFKILDIRDGVNLFRNPTQTMNKLAQLIPNLQRGVAGLPKFWFGAVQDSKLGTVPVYVPNLLDSREKVLDIPLINRIINQEIQGLDEATKQVIVYYVDIDDGEGLERFVRDNNATTVKVELRDLKNVLHEVVVEDTVDFTLAETGEGYTVRIDTFVSDRLGRKLEEFNGKGELNAIKKGEAFTPLAVSEEGLELIELVALDCKNADGVWHSSAELKIDRRGYVTRDGEKTKTFWDGLISAAEKPLRLKVRSISGDETIWAVD